MKWLHWSLCILFRWTEASVFRPNGDAAAWLLWNHPTAIFDPPYCAVSTTMVINDIVLSAQDVVAMTGDCMGDLESPPDCAADITDFIANILDAAQGAAAMATACAGEISDCEQLTIDAAEMFTTLASYLVGASTNCDVDAFLCTINLVDSIKVIFGAATDIQSAVDTCPKDSALMKYIKTYAYPDWHGWEWISRRLTAGRMNATSDGLNARGEDTPVPRRMGIVDETVPGPIIAADDPGLVRVGSAIAVPRSEQLLRISQKGARRLAELEAVEVPTLQDVDIDVWHLLDYQQEMHGEMAFE
ncbi:unnamed protein product [Durusdinium trenchii]|uniref:Uncharacterized protein n=1 Tax=Durusdinium trenchii TaxID=1381693 RepID=A0ABP0RDI6_9DINO